VKGHIEGKTFPITIKLITQDFLGKGK